MEANLLILITVTNSNSISKAREDCVEKNH